jgi:hypothetical protein
MEDMRLVVLSYSLMMQWYYCTVCTFTLPDEIIYQAVPVDRM